MKSVCNRCEQQREDEWRADNATRMPDIFDFIYDVGYAVVAISTVVGGAFYLNVLKPGYENYTAWVRKE